MWELLTKESAAHECHTTGKCLKSILHSILWEALPQAILREALDVNDLFILVGLLLLDIRVRLSFNHIAGCCMSRLDSLLPICPVEEPKNQEIQVPTQLLACKDTEALIYLSFANWELLIC